MRAFLMLLLRCAVILGLAFVPMANALNMAAMAASQTADPPCHAPASQSDDTCCQAAGQCHCAMASCLPAVPAGLVRFPLPSDHPQTAHPLALGQNSVPETPPPRSMA